MITKPARVILPSVKRSGWLLILLGFLWAPGAVGQVSPTSGQVVVRSHSGQFVVSGVPQTPRGLSGLSAPSNDPTQRLHLETPLVPLMCERIKQALLLTLGSRDHWQGQIYISIYASRDKLDPILAVAEYSPGSWAYRLEVPSEVEPSRLLRVVVEALLLEMANRNAGPESAEMPPWLSIGVTAHLHAVHGVNLMIQDSTRSTRVDRKKDLFKTVRAELAEHAPLTLDELNWPSDEALANPIDGIYPACARLLVHELLLLRGGTTCMMSMLDQLPHCRNWQTAFVTAFQPHFSNLRDMEKWWAITTVGFTGRDVNMAWNVRESWDKLDEILTSSVQIYTASNGIPFRQNVPLQKIISEWSFDRQKPVLRQKLDQLRNLRQRIAPPLLKLSGDYFQTIQNYLSRRAKAGFGPEYKGQAEDSSIFIARETVQKLDILDEVCADLKRMHPPAYDPVRMNTETGPPKTRAQATSLFRKTRK